MRARAACSALLCALAAASLWAVPASAQSITPFVYAHKFIDGTGSSGGSFGSNIGMIEINQTNGRVYVREGGTISQFTPNGTPLKFAGLPGNHISTSGDTYGGMAVNSISGNIYTGTENGEIFGFTPTGEPLPFPFPLPSSVGYNCGLTGDPTNTSFWMADYGNGLVKEFLANGDPSGKSINTGSTCDVAVDTKGNVYSDTYGGPVLKYDKFGNFQYAIDGVNGSDVSAINPADNSLFILEGNSQVSHWDVSSTTEPVLQTVFGGPEPANGYEGLEGVAGGSRGIAVYGASGEVYVSNRRNVGGAYHVDVFKSLGTVVIPDVVTGSPTVEATTATLHGTVDADGGGDTTDCHFEWGSDQSYGNVAPCVPQPISGSGPTPVSAQISGLETGNTYNFRLVASNAQNIQAQGSNQEFRPSGPPTFSGEIVTEVNTDGARLSGRIDTGGSTTTYHIEYGLADCETGACLSVPTPDAQLTKSIGAENMTQLVTGLIPGETYHWRIVAKNDSATSEGDDHTFTTFPLAVSPETCPNELMRQQTKSAFLLDCRAYELVSAANTGGFDVSSDVVSGQVPLPGAPEAENRVLYALSVGIIPGISGVPTNYGLDPYLATRTASGWTTSYVGISASGTPSTSAFGSPLAGSDDELSSFAFGGATICDPCFESGETGIPVRRGGGEIVQGMAGSLNPTGYGPEGYVGRYLSEDGSHLVFGSSSQFEPDGNSNGDISIYSRDLQANVTRVVSKTPAGATMTGPGIGALDISADGSRAIVAQRISTDEKGNGYWHPYMHVGSSANTVDLAPGTTSGVLYAGMTGDGSSVFYVTPDKLVAGDTDASPDLYRADVAGGSAIVTRVSSGSGGSSNSDACDPAPNNGPHWNVVGPAANCGVAAIGGGGGVAPGGEAIFFLSPELLDGSEGVADQPNLYVSRAGGAPELVATLEPDGLLVRRAVADTEVRNSADLQVDETGAHAVFASQLPLTGFPTLGRSNIYRYAAGGGLDCVSCAPTGAASSEDTRLSAFGRNLTDDGRVFFTTAQQLVLRDTAGKLDAYEWRDGEVQLISSGISTTNSGLLSATADGRDVYFFTRETLSPEDESGGAMKIYDARELGGFLRHSAPVPCQAADECRGPGTQAAPPAAIGTFEGTGGQHRARNKKVKCKGKRVKKRGRCVKKGARR